MFEKINMGIILLTKTLGNIKPEDLQAELLELKKAESMHDIRRHNGNIDKDYIRDEKGKKVYLTYEDWKERNE